MLQAVVPTDADDDVATICKLLLVIGEIRGLERTTGRSIFRIEEQNDIVLVPESGKIDGFHVGIREDEERCHLSFFQHINLLEDLPWTHHCKPVALILPIF